ncbi:hypothetical protein BH09GEM1_BH09GEM1_22910 [soil metagenome]
MLAVVVLSCRSPGDGETTEPLVPEVAEVDESEQATAQLLLEPARISVETYDGSGEMVHPDALVFPHRWNGRRYWFIGTPYPLGNSTLENPSGFAGDSAGDWRPIPGVANPIARPATDAYLSDPDLTYDSAHDRVHLYYRQTTGSADQLYLRTSKSGSDWSEPTLVLADQRYSLISPAVVREDDGTWRMWTVNAAAGGCRVRASALTLSQRTSRDGMKWNPATPVNLAIVNHVPWHWDVQYIRARKEYWALIAAYPDGSNCSRTSIYFARSAGGTTWHVSPTPLLEPGALQPLRDLVYRSTFRYFASDDAVRVWFSGAREDEGKFHYSLAIARYPLAELLRRVDAPNPADRTASAMRQHDPRDSELRLAREGFVNAFP